MESPLHRLGDCLPQAQVGDALFQGLEAMLRSGWLRPHPLALLLEAPLFGLALSLLPGALGVLVVGSGLGHGILLRVVASPRFSCGGDHDPLFI